MYYEHVEHSFFTYPDWYKFVYNYLKDGDTFVEIGTWTGASSLFFAELIKGGKKKIDFYTIDTFEGSEEHNDWDIIKDGRLYEYYMSVREPLKDYIKVIKGDSHSKEIADKFANESLDAIFIDGDHSHAGVKKDLDVWFPKIKTGSLMSGHDYIWGGHGVKPVVDFFSGFKVIPFWQGDVWYYYKQKI